MTFITYKLCFWMQTIYFHNCLGPYRVFSSKERLYAPSGYHLDTISYSNVTKLLLQFDCTTCLEMLWKVLTISEVKPFLAGQLCQVNFQTFSSLTTRDGGTLHM